MVGILDLGEDLGITADRFLQHPRVNSTMLPLALVHSEIFPSHLDDPKAATEDKTHTASSRWASKEPVKIL